jgi:hypothetical protein
MGPVAVLTAISLFVSATSSGCSWFGDDDVVAFRDGVAAHEDTGARVVAPGHDGAEVTFRQMKDPPPADTMPFTDRIGDPVDITPPAGVTGAEVRLAFDPAKELPAAAAGGERPTVANTFLAVYDRRLSAWMPLETRFDEERRELVATTPHFSPIGRFSVRPGRWSLPNPLSAIGAGVSKTIDVVHDTATTGVQALQQHLFKPVADYAAHMWEEVAGAYPGGKHVDCGAGKSPDGESVTTTSKAVAAPGWTATASGELADKLRVCVAAEPSGPSQVLWLRMENHLGAPLNLFPPRSSDLPPKAQYVSVMWNDYDVAMIDDPLLLLRRFLAAGAASSIVAGTRGSQLEITDDRTAFTVGVTVDWFAVTLDLTMVLLSVLAPATRAWAKEVLGWQHAVTRKVVRDDKGRPVKTLTPEDLAPWRSASDAGQLVDLYNCLKGAVNAAKEPQRDEILDMARQCISTVFDNAVAGVAGGVLANLKAAPELRDLALRGRQKATITVRPPSTGAPSDIAGEQYAFLKKVDASKRTVTFDLVDWFWKADALQACREDGVQVQDNAMCNEYYYRNRNPKLRTMTVTEDAVVRGIVTGSPTYQEVPITLARLETWPTVFDLPYKMRITDGSITSLSEVFVP